MPGDDGDDQDSPALDDRRPALLVILDGLGDRLDGTGLTVSERASTPNLDRFVAEGVSGLHVPFGPGVAPSSETAHWALFGYEDFQFCGRSVLEALGAGKDVPIGTVMTHGSLRPSAVRSGMVWPTGRAGAGDADDAHRLLADLATLGADRFPFALEPLGGAEASIAMGTHASADITDSDPLFDGLHPWMKVLPYADARDLQLAADTATLLNNYLRWARQVLKHHPVNARRAHDGRARLDVLTTKWTGCRSPLPTFAQRTGIAGGIVAATRLYGGFAALLDMHHSRTDPGDRTGLELEKGLAVAAEWIASGLGFVHVHVKATDEAGHSKDPELKRTVLEEIDRSVEVLMAAPFDDVVIAITGDHATPSTGGVLHTGDPSPLVIRGPDVGPDAVVAFAERSAADGWLGRVRARDVLPLMFSYANRPAYRGTRVSPHDPVALPDAPEPMPDV